MATDVKAQLDDLKSRLRVEKIVATRSLRTPTGDIFCGLSASFKQDGLGPGLDLLPSDGESAETSNQGMSHKEVSPAYLYLQHRAYLLCLDSAVAEGAMTEHVALNLKTEASKAFALLLAKALRVPENTHDAADSGG